MSWNKWASQCTLDWSTIYWAEYPLLIIDTETTGFSSSDRICEISLVRTQGGEVLNEFRSLVNPGFPIPSDSTDVHGIEDYDVVDAPAFSDILDQVLELLVDETPWVAHGMSFDARMLRYDIPEERWPRGIPTLCTLDYAKHRNAVTKMRGKHKLVDLANYFHVDYDPDEIHRASYDTHLLAKVVPYLMGGREVGKTMTRLSHEW